MWLIVLVLFKANHSNIHMKNQVLCVMAMNWVCLWIGEKTVGLVSPAVSFTQPKRSKPSAKRITNYSASTASWVTGTKIMKSYRLPRPPKNTALSSGSTRKPQLMSHRSWYPQRTKFKGTYSWWNFRRSRIEESSAYFTMLSETCLSRESRLWKLTSPRCTRKRRPSVIQKLFK